LVHSFSTTSFSAISFATRDYVDVGENKGQSKKNNKWRNYIASLARTFKRLFTRQPQPEEPTPIPIPAAQPRKTVTILAKEPETIQEAEQLVTINDKWEMPKPKASIVASSPPPVVYPVIKNTFAAPIIMKRPHLPGYAVSSGEHFEHSIVNQSRLPKPKINSKTASILLQLLTIEAIIDGISDDGE
jgi:hypothetical protein